MTGSCSSGGRPLIIVASGVSIPASFVHITVSLSRMLQPELFLVSVYGVVPGNRKLLLPRSKARTEKDICEDWSICPAGFATAFCADALSVSIDVSEASGGVPSPRAHLPLLLQSAVPCGAPDVVCRIIHTHALMKVSIWPHMHTLSPQNHTGMGTLESLCSPCCSM